MRARRDARAQVLGVGHAVLVLVGGAALLRRIGLVARLGVRAQVLGVGDAVVVAVERAALLRRIGLRRPASARGTDPRRRARRRCRRPGSRAPCRPASGTSPRRRARRRDRRRGSRAPCPLAWDTSLRRRERRRCRCPSAAAARAAASARRRRARCARTSGVPSIDASPAPTPAPTRISPRDRVLRAEEQLDAGAVARARLRPDEERAERQLGADVEPSRTIGPCRARRRGGTRSPSTTPGRSRCSAARE